MRIGRVACSGRYVLCVRRLEHCAQRSHSARAPVTPTAEMNDSFYRRTLPHWRQDQKTYCVTWRLARGQPELGADERDVVVSAIKRFDRQLYELAAFFFQAEDGIRDGRVTGVQTCALPI